MTVPVGSYCCLACHLVRLGSGFVRSWYGHRVDGDWFWVWWELGGLVRLSLTSRHVWGFARTYHEFPIFSQSKGNLEACLYTKSIRSAGLQDIWEPWCSRQQFLWDWFQGPEKISVDHNVHGEFTWEDFGEGLRIEWTGIGLIKSWASAKHCEIGYLLLTAASCSQVMTFQLSFCQKIWKNSDRTGYSVIAKAQITFLSTIPGGWLLAFVLQCQKDWIS